jgi:predicted TIM-barrel fold metal-dependent hydrolase
MSPQAIQHAQRLTRFLEAHKERLVIDADVHVTDLGSLAGPARERYAGSPDYYHGRPVSAEEILAEMRLAEVDMAVIWQNPAATAYAGDPSADFDALLAANHYVRDAAARYPDRFIPGGWVDPKACGVERTLELVETLVTGFGFLFVKLNPAQHRCAIDSDPIVRVVERIVELGAIPAFHFGADTPFTPAEGLEHIATLNAYHPVLAIHMGGGGAGYAQAEDLSQQARELGLRHPNIRFALSAKRDAHIENDLIAYQLAGEPFSQNLFCASDAPCSRMTWNFGGFRAMFRSLLAGANHTDARVRAQPDVFTETAVQGYLGRNLAEFVIAGYRFLLRVQGVR